MAKAKRPPPPDDEPVRKVMGAIVPRAVVDPWTDVDEKSMFKLGMLKISLRQCADYYGMTWDPFWKLLEYRPELRLAYNKGKAQGIVTVASHMLRKAADGDLFAQKYYLDAAGWGTGAADPPSFGGPEVNEGEGALSDQQQHGVLIVPQDAVSIEEWERRQSERRAAGNTDSEKPT